MAVTPKVFNSGTQLTTTAAAYWTSTNIKSIVDYAKLMNFTTGVITVTGYRVPSGQSAGNSYIIMKSVSIEAGQTYHCPEIVGATLETGDSVQLLASAAASVSVQMGGRTFNMPTGS